MMLLLKDECIWLKERSGHRRKWRHWT